MTILTIEKNGLPNGYRLEINQLSYTQISELDTDWLITLSVIDTVKFKCFDELPVRKIPYLDIGYEASILGHLKSNYREFSIQLYYFIEDNQTIRFELLPLGSKPMNYWNLIGYVSISIERVTELWDSGIEDVDLRKILEHDLFKIESIVNQEVFGGKLYRTENCDHCKHTDRELICEVGPVFGRDWINNGLYRAFSDDIREKLNLSFDFRAE